METIFEYFNTSESGRSISQNRANRVVSLKNQRKEFLGIQHITKKSLGSFADYFLPKPFLL